MSDPKNKGSAEQPPGPAPPASEKRSGRVGFDERGNSVWEWQLETGVYSRDVSTQKLKKLELGELSIAETAVNKRPRGLGESTKAPMPGGGFNPYDNSPQAGGGFNPYDNAKALGKKFQPAEPTSSSARKPTDLKKLEEWMKLKKRAEDAKDRDDD
jgi:hypothetical protein